MKTVEEVKLGVIESLVYSKELSEREKSRFEEIEKEALGLKTNFLRDDGRYPNALFLTFDDAVTVGRFFLIELLGIRSDRLSSDNLNNELFKLGGMHVQICEDNEEMRCDYSEKYFTEEEFFRNLKTAIYYRWKESGLPVNQFKPF